MNFNDYMYYYFILNNYNSKVGEEKIKFYNKAMFEYLNSNILIKRDNFEELFDDYYYIVKDKNKFFNDIFILNFSILSDLLNKSIYIDYDDNLECDEYRINYLRNEDCFEVLISSSANICNIGVNSFFDMEKLYMALKRELTAINCIKRLN